MRNLQISPFKNISNSSSHKGQVIHKDTTKLGLFNDSYKPPLPRTMYSSSIQPQIKESIHNGFDFESGLGALGSMGRQVKQEGCDSTTNENDHLSKNVQKKPLCFNSSKMKKTHKMCASVIVPFHSQVQSQKNSNLPKFGANFKAKSMGIQLISQDNPQSLKINNVSSSNSNNLNNYSFKLSRKSSHESKLAPEPLQASSQQKTVYKGLFQNIGKEIKQQEVKPQVIQQENVDIAGFKKKKFAFDLEDGKSDQNLLKALGINLKSAESPKKTAQINNIRAIEPIIMMNSHSLAYQPKPVQKIEKKNVFKKSDFQIGKKMGKGQFGQVMLVRHKLTGFVCGMKIMSKKQIRQQKYQNQIARQLSIQFYLSHRNVGPLYGYFQDEDNVYLLVEFCCEGQLLEKLRKNRRMEEEQVSPIIREICEGLDYIHREDIIHRDIKPQNILFNFGTVKISDFGWAVFSNNGMRRTTSGSPLYYSPQIVQQTQYDQKSDLWAIGMMTYECLIGKIPFKIYSELDLNRIVDDEITFPQYVDVTDEAKDFILGIMKKKPEERMVMRDILRHPFITKYLKNKNVDVNVLGEFKKVLTQ